MSQQSWPRRVADLADQTRQYPPRTDHARRLVEGALADRGCAEQFGERGALGSAPSGADAAHVPQAATTGFLIRLNEVNVNASVKSDGKHTTEKVGWLATTI